MVEIKNSVGDTVRYILSSQQLVTIGAWPLTDYDCGQIISTAFYNFINNALLLSS